MDALAVDGIATAIPIAAAATPCANVQSPDAHRLCVACEVTWAGPPTSCWSCGHPATAAYTCVSALRTLLRVTRPAPALPHDATQE